jgi:hypothetical protein
MKDGVETQTVRDDIIAAMEKHDEPEAKELQTAEPDEPIEATEPEPKEQPSRGKDGKFAKKAESAAESTDAGADDGEDVPEGQAEPEPADDEQVSHAENKRPPQALSAAIKGKWSEIPDDLKNEFIRLETASARGVSGLKEDARIGRTLMDEIKPYEGLINSAGATPQTVVRDLMRTAAILRTGTPAQKQNTVLQIIQEYGIQMNGLEPAYEDPYLAKINQLEQQLASQQQARIQQEESQVLTTVDSFLNEADERGNPKFPLDEGLEAEFVDEIAAVRRRSPSLSDRQVLETAYERMSWKVPEIRQTLLERQRAESEAKRKEKAAQEVAKKQQASVSVKGTAANSVPNSDLSIREMLERQILGTGNRI